MLVIVGLFALFWLLVIRPQRRRQRTQAAMIRGLEVGDEIVTAGGIYGEITGLDDDEVRVEIAEGVEVRVARRAVAGVFGEDEEYEEDEEPEEEELEAEPASESRRES